MPRKPILLTMGDPAGIGPEIIAKALRRADVRALGPFLVLGDPRAFGRLPAGVELRPVGPAGRKGRGRAGARAPWRPGEISAAAGRASFAAVEEAIRLTLAGLAAALVTAPIQKEAWGRAGVPFPGHTELLEARCREWAAALPPPLGEGQGGGVAAPIRRKRPAFLTPSPALPQRERGRKEPPRALMLMVGGGLRVGLATIHVPLAEVPRLLTVARIVAAGRIMAAGLRTDFGLRAPRLAVLGLNPHAGEGGRFGDEEARIIAPAVAALRAAGVAAEGPVVPDVAFFQARAGRYDGILAMYHDQGCIPVKTLAFDRGVNCTLGLPLVRTSPDHGTAFEIAWRGVASERSLVEALKLAARIARRRGLR